MYCYDKNEECTFAIWKGKRRYYFGRGGNFVSLKKRTMLDVGETLVFRARSRLEREEWVWAFKVEIERFLRDNCTC